MTLEAIAVTIIVGLVAGWLAGFVLKGGGYGLVGDILLGIGGSIVGTWLFRSLGIASGGGWFPMVAVAFVGAVLLIYAQRMLWQVRA
jgi:uncharacterized membrane protein YeaQ/YmgE (transglycosylase-associated protein family)